MTVLEQARKLVVGSPGNFRDWNTTIVGISVIVVAVFETLRQIFSGEIPDYNLAVASVVAGIRLIFASDKSPKGE